MLSIDQPVANIGLYKIYIIIGLLSLCSSSVDNLVIQRLYSIATAALETKPFCVYIFSALPSS